MLETKEPIRLIIGPIETTKYINLTFLNADGKEECKSILSNGCIRLSTLDAGFRASSMANVLDSNPI
ncbi:hypothetical protein BpHYR1_035563 [Brachionus plicatilis]|uniref:Uncharacterized protein n=1 Tax=Brachionus plicatilis TaxID=10195 RepID=A0A3M7P2Y4_BRAPC|nr:hypothetical protein BpHYR1_035563 [Brachionus plicatilis]